MEWKGFLIFTRFSYGLYLTQFPIFFFNVGITKSPEQYSMYGSVVSLKAASSMQ